jgi:Secretion system C-terminal sorting domain
MRERFAILVVGLMILAMGGLSQAQDLIPIDSGIAPLDYNLLPSEFDVYSDSLYQFTNAGWVYYATQNFYGQVKFLAPADFSIRGMSMIIYDPNAALSTCSVYFYSPNIVGGIGTLLDSIVNGTPDVVSLGNGYWYARLEFTDPNHTVDIASGDEFWMSVGPVQNLDANGWTLPLDDDGDASNADQLGFSPGLSSQPTGRDWFVYVLGNIAQFSNVRAAGMTNDLLTFQVRPETSLTLTAHFDNTGTAASVPGTAVFSVKNSSNVEVFTETVALPAVTPGDTVSVVTTTTWAPNTTDRYIAEVTSVVAGDGDNTDDNFMLLQNVIDGDGWYAYDDDASETSVNFGIGNGSGSVFYPIEYPATLDSVSLYFPSAQTGEIINVFWLDPSINTYADLWTGTFDVVLGWNTFPIDDETVAIENGGFAISYQAVNAFSIPLDTDRPTSAANNFMDPASMTYYSNPPSFQVSSSGNWMVRGKITSFIPPDPPVLVFPQGIIEMEGAVVGEPLSMIITIENNGIGIGELSEITNYVPDQMTIPDQNNVPIILPPNTTYDMEFIWTPINTNMTNIGVQIAHNDPFLPDNPVLLAFQGTAAENAVSDHLATVPTEYFLDQNRPNPFNPETSITFGLTAPGMTNLRVFNVMGQQVATILSTELMAGEHTVSFNGSELPSGVYFYSIEVNGYQSIQKMVLMK